MYKLNKRSATSSRIQYAARPTCCISCARIWCLLDRPDWQPNFRLKKNDISVVATRSEHSFSISRQTRTNGGHKVPALMGGLTEKALTKNLIFIDYLLSANQVEKQYNANFQHWNSPQSVVRSCWQPVGMPILWNEQHIGLVSVFSRKQKEAARSSCLRIRSMNSQQDATSSVRPTVCYKTFSLWIRTTKQYKKSFMEQQKKTK